MSEETIFVTALEKANPAERAAYLDAACGGDVELRRRVEALLLAHERSGDLLDPAGRDAGSRTALAADLDAGPRRAGPIAEGSGTRIGPYKLLQQIGEGGMGSVYMAEQTEPVRRRVALKIIKPGMDSRQVIARFEAERQALAMMDHQNIARILDVGTTDSGRPFFVMELVHGVPITQYCDDRHLTPRERLALFVPVCRALQHAHQKGIIHRDIKPSNVLVTMYDDKPVPKVIDFGVAKAIEQRLTERTMFTQFGALVGTFEYMSPEQAEMNAFGVDTRSDIYSLGVLLYELLTGSTPIERARLRSAALHELVRLIKEEEAPRPSVRLSSSDHLPAIAAARKTEPDRLARLVRGELDWIVMKCLEKDRTRRYDTANGLARDVEHYLADEPVEACPPSARYRLGKFARKHTTALATGAAFALLLVVGVVVSSVLAVRATLAGREARRQQIAAEKAGQAALEAKAEADAQRDAARRDAYATGMGLAQRAWDDNNVERAGELLAEVPREVGGRDLRGFEWYYLSRLCQSVPLTLKGHASLVDDVVFSPDGRRLASSSWDKTVKLWDVATGQELASLDIPTDLSPAYSQVLSPDGRRLATVGRDHTVKVRDAETGRELISLAGQTERIPVAFSPDGRRLASGWDDTSVKIWEIATGTERISIKGRFQSLSSLAFSPDGRRLAAGFDSGTVKIWDATTGQEVASFEGRIDRPFELAFSPDGRRLTAGSWGNLVKVWDSATGQERLALSGHTDRAASVAFSPDGRRLASGSDDRSVKIWDTATGRELATLKGHAGLVTSVAWSPDGWHLASASVDGTIRIWDAATAPEVVTLKGHDIWLGGIAFSPDGRRLAADIGNIARKLVGDDAVKIWDVATGRVLSSLKGHPTPVEGMAFSPDGRRLTTLANRDGPLKPSEPSGDQTMRVWDVATGKELASCNIHTGPTYGSAFSPDGRRLVSAGHDGVVKIWDAATGREVASWEGHTRSVDLAFSPDGRRVASGGRDGMLKIWDAATGQELISVKGHTESIGRAAFIGRVAFSPDGRRLATASSDRTVKVWDVATGRELLTLKGHAGWVDGVAFSPDGRRVATGSRDGTVKLWDAETGKELSSLHGHAGSLSFVAFSADGRRLAASANGDGSVKIWEASVPPEDLERRAAEQVVAGLFRELGLRDDVLERLETATGLSPSRRREALDAARAHPEDASALNDLAWELVKSPGRDRADYRRALRCAEQAGRLEPGKAGFLTTMGVAYYRADNPEKAVETLERSSRIRPSPGGGASAVDLAFLAMAHHRLGRRPEARASLDRLRASLKDPRRAQDAEAQGFLREAESLVAGARAPAGP